MSVSTLLSTSICVVKLAVWSTFPGTVKMQSSARTLRIPPPEAPAPELRLMIRWKRMRPVLDDRRIWSFDATEAVRLKVGSVNCFV